MEQDLFRIREARPSDLPSLNAFSAAEGMGAIEADDCLLVAANPDDEPVGFIRLVFDEHKICHVNPVIVYDGWRRYGVGRALIEEALQRYGELRLVSRGTSLAFYQALGFEEISWEDVSEAIAAECYECDYMDECAPVPVRKFLLQQIRARVGEDIVLDAEEGIQ